MTKIIGLTGGIGSGKTTIANHYKSLGIPVYIADEEARKITETTLIIEKIKKKFGTTIFEGEIINREKLAQIVFNDPGKLKVLNSIIHPAVKQHFEHWVKEHSNYPIIIKEAAILFESGSYKDCDKIITIVVPLQTRIIRVMQRDKLSEEQVLDRLKNQWTDEQRIAKSDFIIENSNLEYAKHQANEILKKLSNQQNSV